MLNNLFNYIINLKKRKTNNTSNNMVIEEKKSNLELKKGNWGDVWRKKKAAEEILGDFSGSLEQLQMEYSELQIKFEKTIDRIYEEANRFYLRSGDSSDCKFIKNKLFDILEDAGFAVITVEIGDPLPPEEESEINWWNKPSEGKIIDVERIGLKNKETGEIRHLIRVTGIPPSLTPAKELELKEQENNKINTKKVDHNNEVLEDVSKSSN
jgi:hypothetical protein